MYRVNLDQCRKKREDGKDVYSRFLKTASDGADVTFGQRYATATGKVRFRETTERYK